MTIQKIAKALLKVTTLPRTAPSELWTRFLIFPTEDRQFMPAGIRERFYTNDLRAHISKYIDYDTDGGVSYEIRCRINGNVIKAHAPTIEETKQAFFAELHNCICA